MSVKQGLVESERQSTALPVEIGFLAHHGYAPSLLHEAALLAELAGVPADVLLLKQGLVAEHEFYRALALELGLPFLRKLPLSPDARYPDSILAGFAPLRHPGIGFVLAPSGTSLIRLLTRPRPPEGSLAITTPSILSRAVIQAKAHPIAHRAAHDLLDRWPELSCKDGPSLPQIAVASCLSLFLSSGSYIAPEPVLAWSAAILSPLFFGMIVLRLATSFLRAHIAPTVDAPRAADADLPIYTLIVALYRERRVVPHLIASLAKLDYPAAKLDIKLVIEAGDRETSDALAACAMPGFMEVIVAPKGRPQTKPRALNVALPLARGRYTAIYDAEDVPDPGQLRLAVSMFDRASPAIACLQARLTIDNTDDSWLTRLFTIEYAALFDVFNPGLAEIGSPIALGGTSNHFRTAVLRKLCGWDAWNVTEDADLGIRLARFGYRVADLPSSTLEEAPSTLRAWMNQRTRWMKGFMQTSISHSRKPWSPLLQLGPWRFYGALVLTGGTVLSALVYPFFTGMILLSWTQEASWSAVDGWDALWRSYSLVLFVSGLLAVVIPACVALHRRRLWRLLPWIVLLPIYYGLVSVAAWRSLWEFAVAMSHWNKTSHGLARTSRSGLLPRFRNTRPRRL